MTRSPFRYAYVLLMVLLIGGCDDGTGFASAASGDPELDQAAVFVQHIIKLVHREHPDWSAREVGDYIVSTQGQAALWPPNPQTEPHLAGTWKGPRPPDGVDIAADRDHPFARKFLVLVFDEESGVILGRGYDSRTAGEPVFEWRFEH